MSWNTNAPSRRKNRRNEGVCVGMARTTQRIGNVCTFHPKERNSKLFLKGVEDLLKRYVGIMKLGTIKREGDEELKFNGPYTKDSFISCFAYPVLTIETHILKATLFFF